LLAALHQPPAAPQERRLLHGSTALLLAHPKAYGLTKQKAIEDTEATLRHLFDRSE
jgi:hypothetical protein